MKRWIAIAVILLALLSGMLVHRSHTRRTLSYWQTQAHKVAPGMARKEVEEILPPQRFDGFIDWLETWRVSQVPLMPSLRPPLAFALVHSDNDNLVAYEVCEGVSVILRYDMAGYTPSRQGVQSPEDRVTFGPIVSPSPVCTDGKFGRGYSDWVQQMARRHFGH
jgi:hypothetical protein